MADRHTKEQRSHNMAAIHSSSTQPELSLRHALWRQGFRYLINDKHLPGRPDIVLPRYRTAIFVHGCFWHGHNGCKYYNVPKTNTEFWAAKIARNKERDQEVWRKLEAKGWSVIIVWECQLKKANFEKTINWITTVIIKNGETYLAIQEERRKNREVYRLERRTRQKRESLLMEEANTL